MAYSKIIFNGTTQIDLTQDTVVADKLYQSYTAHGADGLPIVGTATGGGGGEPEEKDVDFIDYDGTLLYSYSADEFLAMSAMPGNPTHTGLTAQGWNWTLADAKTYVGKYGALVVGQNYITSDGKTKAYISLGATDTQRTKDVTIYMNAIDSSTADVVIDWGDGSTATSRTITGGTNFAHTYNDYGDYVITIDISNPTGEVYLGYWGSNSAFVEKANYCVRKIEIGSNVHGVLSKAFKDMLVLESVSIPKTCVHFADKNEGNTNVITAKCIKIKGIVIPHGCVELNTGSVAFIGEQRYIQYVSFPKSITNFGTMSNTFTITMSLRKLTLPEMTTFPNNANVFTDLTSISHLVIPINIGTIGGNSFTNIYKVRKLILPSTLTAISSNYGLSFPYSMKELICLPTTPPALGHNRFIGSLPSDCVIKVPYSEDHSILEAYKTATNWSVGASKMVEEPQS